MYNGSFNQIDKISKVKDGLSSFVKNQPSNKLIYEGVVVSVDKYGGKWTRLGKATPQNTLQAYIPEIDSSAELSSLNFYEPLFPNHLCSPPELKEEVIILFDSPKKTKGYWIRRNDTPTIKFSQSKPMISDEASFEDRIGAQITKDGQPYDFKDNDETPDYSDAIPYYRRKSGDFFQEGRSNTAINHTFDIKNKKGVIDIITERQGDTDNYSDLSRIKEKEFPETKGSRIMMVTKHNIDKNKDWKLIEEPGFKYEDMTEEENKEGDKNEHKDRSYIYAESEEYRFVSRLSEEKLNNSVLGNNMEIWLCSFIDVLIQLSEVVAKSETQAITITSGHPNSINLMSGGMEAVRQKLKQMKKEIHKHHSKTFFIN